MDGARSPTPRLPSAYVGVAALVHRRCRRRCHSPSAAPERAGGGEAVVFLRAELATRATYVRKMSPSCRRRCASSPPSSTPCSKATCGSRDAGTQRDGPTLLRRPMSCRRRHIDRQAAGQQPVPQSCRRSDRAAAAGLEFLLGLGRRGPPGAVDDVVGHHGDDVERFAAGVAAAVGARNTDYRRADETSAKWPGHEEAKHAEPRPAASPYPWAMSRRCAAALSLRPPSRHHV